MGLNSGRLHDAVTQGELTAVEAQLSAKAAKVQSAWTAPTLLNGAANYGSNYQPMEYRKNEFNCLEIRGVIAPVANATTIFELPAGFRPLKWAIIPAGLATGTTNVGFEISLTGVVKVYGTHSLFCAIFASIPLD